MKQLPSHYDSIDMPIYFWNKIHETEDLSWLLIKRMKINKTIIQQLSKVWDIIYNEYISEFGFSENFISIQNKKIEIARLQLEMIISNDKTHEVFIELAKDELEDLKKSISKADFMSSKIAIERTYKFQISMKETSVKEFYSYLKHLDKS